MTCFNLQNIPKSFQNEHGLTHKDNLKIGLRNSSGRRWEVNVNEIAYAFSLGKGFLCFLCDHNVHQGYNST